MSLRTFKHALARVGFWTLAAVSGILLLTNTSLFAGLIVGGVAVVYLLGVTFQGGLDEKLRLQDEQRAHGIKRSLKLTERRLLDQIKKYCQDLRQTALDPDLADETWAKAWEIIKVAPGQDGTLDLQKFIKQLPPLSTDQGPVEVADKIQRDLEKRRQIERELDEL
jgi:hypothetical protein